MASRTKGNDSRWPMKDSIPPYNASVVGSVFKNEVEVLAEANGRGVLPFCTELRFPFLDVSPAPQCPFILLTFKRAICSPKRL